MSTTPPTPSSSKTEASLAQTPQWEQITAAFRQVQDELCQALVEAGADTWREDLWDYEKGEGGGRTRVWEFDPLLDKGGVNFSALEGSELPAPALAAGAPAGSGFRATGVSVVLHPVHPRVPTIHLNVRFFEAKNQWWFGGGIDLTPVYPVPEDAQKFHSALRELCQAHAQDYAQFKAQCDRYFWLPHRQETRGIGGLFFDHLGAQHGEAQDLLDFCCALVRLLPKLWLPLVKRYQNFQADDQAEVQESHIHPSTDTTSHSKNWTWKEWESREKDFQTLRRSRYVEFNLLLDRGTHFGIQSGGRTESILMSLPPVAHWRYDYKAPEGSEEAQVLQYFKPIQWLVPGYPPAP
jgi:coproporphyrinogen III oxidase